MYRLRLYGSDREKVVGLLKVDSVEQGESIARFIIAYRPEVVYATIWDTDGAVVRTLVVHRTVEVINAQE